MARLRVNSKIYFKLAKAKLANSGIVDLTPNKLYTVVSVHEEYTRLGYIFDDVGDTRIVRLNAPCCLNRVANWIVKRDPKEV